MTSISEDLLEIEMALSGFHGLEVEGSGHDPETRWWWVEFRADPDAVGQAELAFVAWCVDQLPTPVRLIVPSAPFPVRYRLVGQGDPAVVAQHLEDFALGWSRAEDLDTFREVAYGAPAHSIGERK